MDDAPRSHTAFLRDPDLPFVESRDTRIAGAPFGTHTHETYAVSVVQEGSTLLGCRGGKWLMGPGSAVFLPPGEPHACNPQPGQTLKYRKFYLGREWFEERAARGPTGDGRGVTDGGAAAFDLSTPMILDHGDDRDADHRSGEEIGRAHV